MESQALVARGPFSEGKWAIENVRLREPEDDEVIVEMVASGICHTDLVCGDNPDNLGIPIVHYPRVLGHEGAGYVRKVGKAVTVAKPGDPVLLSFTSCGTCHVCRTGPPSHCTSFDAINFDGQPVFTDDHSKPVTGRFFGHSSFARHSIVSDKSLVNVAGLELSRDDLRLLAPLGCGLMTGSGTVTNLAGGASPHDAVAVVGLGGVGLGAVMAARNVGCGTIIGIDRVAARLELARELGATHVFDTTGLSTEELVAAVREVADGVGPSLSIDTSGHPPLVAAQIEYSRNVGKIVQVGSSMPTASVVLPMQQYMALGKQYFGATMGHCKPAEYIPRLVQWWKEGNFPVERLVKFYDAQDYASAVKDMKQGGVIKPVLVW